MATTNVTLTNGNYTYVDGTAKVNGDLFLVSGTKNIQRISGMVSDNNVNIGNFTADRNMPDSEGHLRYNISFTDPSVYATLSQIVFAAVAAVEAELE